MNYLTVHYGVIKPKKFNCLNLNIFVGLGGFHTEKVVLACIGKYLEGSGAEEILVQTGCFGPDTVKAVMNGGHYNRSKRGLNLLLCF